MWDHTQLCTVSLWYSIVVLKIVINEPDRQTRTAHEILNHQPSLEAACSGEEASPKDAGKSWGLPRPAISCFHGHFLSADMHRERHVFNKHDHVLMAHAVGRNLLIQGVVSSFVFQ